MKENTRINMAELGLRIRQARIEKNMSQVDLAEVCGLSIPYVSDIERGKKCFSVDILLRIAQALQISADWLLQLDLPQSQYAYSAEAAELLSDCTPEETMMLLKIMQTTKDTLRRVMKKDKP
jgi:transcriptional regulator with XRE-family HTH domain